MKQSIQILIILAIAAIIAIIVCTLFQIEPVYTFTAGLTSAILSFDFTKVSTIMTGLITGLTASAAAAIAGIYKYFKTNKALGQERLVTQQQNTTINSLGQLTDTQKEALEVKEQAITTLTSEKEEAVTKAKNAENLVEQQKQTIHDKEVAMQAQAEQKLAVFTSKLPGDSVITDGLGNTIKTVTQIQVK